MGAPVSFGEEDGIDPCAYIRAYYGVPARIGMRIQLGFIMDPFGKRRAAARTGVITGADHHLYVRMDGEHDVRRIHPTWLIDYLDKDGKVLAHYGDD